MLTFPQFILALAWIFSYAGLAWTGFWAGVTFVDGYSHRLTTKELTLGIFLSLSGFAVSICSAITIGILS